MRQIILALLLGSLFLVPRLIAQSVESRTRALTDYYIRHYSRLFAVPQELAEAILEVESGGNPLAFSSKGAAGLMQLMPETVRRYGVRNRFNLEQNIRAGIQHLFWLSELFTHDYRLVAAAYLSGEQRMLDRGLDEASPEVVSYVRQVAKKYREKFLSRSWGIP